MIHGIFQAERKKEKKALRGREQTNRLAEPSLFMVALNHNVGLDLCYEKLILIFHIAKK